MYMETIIMTYLSFFLIALWNRGLADQDVLYARTLTHKKKQNNNENNNDNDGLATTKRNGDYHSCLYFRYTWTCYSSLRQVYSISKNYTTFKQGSGQFGMARQSRIDDRFKSDASYRWKLKRVDSKGVIPSGESKQCTNSERSNTRPHKCARNKRSHDNCSNNNATNDGLSHNCYEKEGQSILTSTAMELFVANSAIIYRVVKPPAIETEDLNFAECHCCLLILLPLVQSLIFLSFLFQNFLLCLQPFFAEMFGDVSIQWVVGHVRGDRFWIGPFLSRVWSISDSTHR